MSFEKKQEHFSDGICVTNYFYPIRLQLFIHFLVFFVC